MENLSIDSTCIKQGTRKYQWRGKTEDKEVGRTRSGLNTKLHAIVDELSTPVEFLLSAGNDNDCAHAVYDTLNLPKKSVRIP